MFFGGDSFFQQAFGGEGGGHHHHHQQQREEKVVDTTQLYKDLGVEKNIEANQLKKAYHKMARKHHPDRGGDEEKFKQISKAFNILKDKDKRELYDKYGLEGVEKGGPPDSGGDIFSNFFGGGGGQRKTGPKKGKDMLYKHTVTLDEMYNGASKSLKLSKKSLCSECDGKGGKGVRTCDGCKGKGYKVVMRQLGPGMIQQSQSHCGECQGEGEIIPRGARCRKCHGNKIVEAVNDLTLHINKGAKNGSKIKFVGEADQLPGTLPGDLYVKLIEKKHDIFQREGPHLFFSKTITLCEALTGFEFVITHMDRRQLIVQSDPKTFYHDGCVRAIKEEGMPQEGNPYERGNLYIIMNIRYPRQLDEKTKEEFARILPGPAPTMDLSDDREYEDVEIVDVDLASERRKHKSDRRRRQHEQYDEDDDDGGHGQTHECRTQ